MPAPSPIPSRDRIAVPEQPHARPAGEVLAALEVEAARGLSARQAAARRAGFGRNELEQRRARSAWAILLEQLRSVVIYILIAAAAVSFAFGQWTDGSAILIVLVINTAIGFVSEIRAVRSMEALRRLDTVKARVRRDGAATLVPATDLVPGDIVLLHPGDMIPADLRLVEQAALQSDESALTGESVPVTKQVEPVAEQTPLAERADMLYRGCAVTRGTGTGVVTGTGAATEIGRIAALASGAAPEVSPLERRLDTLGRELVWLTIALAAGIAAAGVATGQPLLEMGRVAVALAVAAVPEGLPVVATVALARGMWRMARQNALINRLSAVETLGAVTVILTDKTGTLTENRMTLVRLALPGGEIDLAGARAADAGAMAPGARLALTVAALCNEAPEEGGEAGQRAKGDPMEHALIDAAARAGLPRAQLLKEHPEVRRIPFDRAVMMMATVHRGGPGGEGGAGGRHCMYVKGAPKAVLERCARVLGEGGTTPLDDDARAEWLARNDAMTRDGLRVLALAVREMEDPGTGDIEDLTLVGLAGLLDPARADVADAVAACQRAGVRIVMVTGDQAGTAARIAEQVGIAPEGAATFEGGADVRLDALDAARREALARADVVARVTPERKLELVELAQRSGQIVAMIGDGVNDAPALKKADIGIAMGRRGTDVAREAAGMVLRDDAFATIVVALRQGRVIFDNIRSFVVYLLSCNLSEILLIGAAVLAGLPLPLLPVHILFLNFVTDVFPAFALGFGEGSGGEMRRPPRDPAEAVVSRRHWIGIVLFGLLIAASVLIAFQVSRHLLGLELAQSVTVSFVALAFAQLWHVFNIRAAGSGLLVNEVTRNPFVWAAVAGCMVLLGLAVFVPGLSHFLRLEDPGLRGWALAAAAAAAPLALGQLALLLGLSILGPAPRGRDPQEGMGG